MNQTSTDNANAAANPCPPLPARLTAWLGAQLIGVLVYFGGLARLIAGALGWVYRGLVRRQVRIGRRAIFSQIVRIGVQSVAVICLVNAAIGAILALQMAPPLSDFGQTQEVARIIAIAVFRELGPLISAVVLTGFAGAAIAAELGTMVVNEEIEALQAHALNPVRFLVVPRLIAAVVAMLVLTVLAELVAVGSGMLIGVLVLDIPAAVYLDITFTALVLSDFTTGLAKAGVFGLLIAGIACYQGLKVTGGAAGVGRATTQTVVQSIVLIILTDLLFTLVFYVLGWN